MHPNEMFEQPPLFLAPESATPRPGLPSHQLVHDYTDGSHFFRLLKSTPTPHFPVYQAPHGDSAHDFLVL